MPLENPFGVEVAKADDDRRSVAGPGMLGVSSTAAGLHAMREGARDQRVGSIKHVKAVATHSLAAGMNAGRTPQNLPAANHHGTAAVKEAVRGRRAVRSGGYLREAGAGATAAGLGLLGVAGAHALQNRRNRKQQKEVVVAKSAFGVEHPISKGILGELKTVGRDLKGGAEFGHALRSGVSSGKGISTAESVGSHAGAATANTTRWMKKNPLAATGIAAGGGVLGGAALRGGNN